MKEFFRYFFGYGQTQEFALFGISHFAPILLMIAVIFLIRWQKDRIRNWKHEKAIRYVMAFALIISEMSYYWRIATVPGLNPGALTDLPIFVCGWVVVFCSFMVVGKTRSLFDIAYFWLLSGTVFALLTPTPLNFTGPTRFRYYQFWTEHTLPYIAVFYMIFVHGFRPTVKSAIRSYIALLVLAAIAFWVNMMLPGANYLYMARPESAPSVLDILPPIHWLRVIIMVAVITAMFILAYLPWYLKDKKRESKIRKMTAADKQSVLEMMRVFYTSPAVLSNGSEEIFSADIDNCVNDSPYLEGYVFQDGQELQGYAMIAKSFSTEFGKPCIWIEDLYMKDMYRGQGLGSRFFDFIKKEYPGCIFRLEVEAENTRAIYVYEKNGFTELPYMEMKQG